METREKRLYDYRGFEGTDASLDIALFEYGLIWQKKGKDYKFVFGVMADDAGNYNLFDYAFMPIDTNVKEEYDWAEFDAIYSYTGMTEADWDNMELPRKIYDLLSYYGKSEIFGDDMGFEISGNEYI